MILVINGGRKLNSSEINQNNHFILELSRLESDNKSGLSTFWQEKSCSRYRAALIGASGISARESNGGGESANQMTHTTSLHFARLHLNEQDMR